MKKPKYKNTSPVSVIVEPVSKIDFREMIITTTIYELSPANGIRALKSQQVSK